MGLTSKIRIEIIQFVLVFVNIDDDARPARWSVSLGVIRLSANYSEARRSVVFDVIGNA